MITVLFISFVSYSLKIFPFLSRKLQFSSSGLMAKSIEYAVCFIMGGIIVNVTFGNATINGLMREFDVSDVLALMAIAAAFFVCRCTGSILKSLFVAMTLYITTMVIFHENHPLF